MKVRNRKDPDSSAEGEVAWDFGAFCCSDHSDFTMTMESQYYDVTLDWQEIGQIAQMFQAASQPGFAEANAARREEQRRRRGPPPKHPSDLTDEEIDPEEWPWRWLDTLPQNHDFRNFRISETENLMPAYRARWTKFLAGQRKD
jgi:hypothetical protein